MIIPLCTWNGYWQGSELRELNLRILLQWYRAFVRDLVYRTQACFWVYLIRTTGHHTRLACSIQFTLSLLTSLRSTSITPSRLCLIIQIHFSQDVLHGKVVPPHALKIYGGATPLILNIGTTWRWVVGCTPRPLYPQWKGPWHPMNRLGGTPSRSGHFGPKHKFYCTKTLQTLVVILECKECQTAWRAQHGKAAGFCGVTNRAFTVKLLSMFN